MLKTLSRLSAALLAVAILFTACKKDKEAVPVTEQNLLGSYKLIKQTFKYGSNEIDITTMYNDDCELDDITTLKTGGVFTVEDAGAQCGTEDEGTWTLNSATSITIDDQDFEVVSFDGSLIVLSMDFSNGMDSGKSHLHLKKQ